MPGLHCETVTDRLFRETNELKCLYYYPFCCSADLSWLKVEITDNLV